LLTIHCPIYLVVITSPQINHDMLITIKEHHRAGVIQFIHLVEIWYLSDITQIDDGKILDFFCNRIEGFVHSHTLGVPVVPKADDDDAVLFRFDGFVDMPA